MSDIVTKFQVKILTGSMLKLSLHLVIIWSALFHENIDILQA